MPEPNILKGYLHYRHIAAESAKQRIREAARPTKAERFQMRALVITGVILVCCFLAWLFNKEHIGYLPLYILICISLTYKLVKILFEWYHYWSIDVPAKPVLRTPFTVDMFTTAMPGEPLEMITNTLVAMKKVRYPHTTFLCDEGNDPVLKQLCEDLGVVHVTRSVKIDAKAGNINNALKIASGDICVILDPDHQPVPEFLDEVIPYFEEPELGYVQVVQAYKNGGESWIAQGAAQQTYTFYGPMMMCMSSYGTAQAIGANCTFRRKALDSIGGHAPGLAEDMHTAMQLHAKGWKSVYVPKILTKGLVPASMSAYYKQQLKWSRGTFDLLVHVYPRLFSKFTWRQRIHYFMLPLHYAVGLITLIDILIPLLSLFSGQTPMFFDISEMLLILLPFLCFTLLIRQFAQKWLLEEHEHGLHISGGILLFGSWWVFLTGIIYTFLGVKVPYIPTDKAHEERNNILLSAPSLAVGFLCIIAAVYGLSRDWNPYNFLMAGFSIVNSFLLGITFFNAQQLFIRSGKNFVSSVGFLKNSLGFLKKIKWSLYPNIFSFLKKRAPVIAVLVVIISMSVFGYMHITSEAYRIETVAQRKDAGGFLTGIYSPDIHQFKSLLPAQAFQKSLNNNLQIISIYQSWGAESLEKFPSGLMDDIALNGSIPMITWEPWVSTFPLIPGKPELMKDQGALAAIADGAFDEYIREYALKIRAFNKPVFIRFAHEADNPAYPWSPSGGNTSKDYKEAWKKVVAMFVSLGVSNVTWVFTPWNPATVHEYYPGDQYVDWIGLTCLNYGTAAHDKKWRSFEEVYNPFRKKVLDLQKPVMLAEFGSTNYGGDSGEWLSHAMQVVSNFTEIKSVIFFNSDKDKNWITDWRPAPAAKFINWEIENPGFLVNAFNKLKRDVYPRLTSGIKDDRSKTRPAVQNKPYLTGKPGSFQLIVNGKLFYVKGIAYNSGDWRDINFPPTRRQLEKDFKAIRATGCNTIRRYQPSVYDRNILTIAQEQHLKVLYGFWFDPSIDYLMDTNQVKKYMDMVVEKVKLYKDYPSVLGWSIGNETSGLLKKHYDQPYLFQVRKAYMEMLEKMAKRIHALDQTRPVLTSLEHSWQLPGELFSYNQLVPSVDIIGINSYYEEQISKVKQLTGEFDQSRPYLISEFGPGGYWNPDLSDYNKYGLLLEEEEKEKAELYYREWNEYVSGNKGYNIGGVAFCWRDRMEGSATWFGITDFKQRKKPVYYALKNAWTNTKATAPPDNVFIMGPEFKLNRGNSYNFTYISNNPVFKYAEWHLYKENEFREKENYLGPNNYQDVWIMAPVKPGAYRLYVHVSDGRGNVVTSSKPLIYKAL